MVDEFGELAPRIGFFHDFQKEEFLVKRWDNKNEDISSEGKPSGLLLIYSLRSHILHEIFE